MSGDIVTAVAGQQVRLKKISEIKISERQRKLDPQKDPKGFKEWLAHIERLGASIKRIGLIHPIVLEDGTEELVAGFSRLNAFLTIGREEIPCVYRSELTALDRKVMELEENLGRLDISPEDRLKAIAEIDGVQRELAHERGETWTTQKTADLTGLSVGTISQAKKVIEVGKTNPEVLKALNAGGLVSALNKIKAGEALEKRKQVIQMREEGKIPLYPAEILVGDAYALIQEQPAESFDAVITNFPFGIELTIGKDQKQVYHDEEDYIVKLVRAVTRECHRVLRPDSWMLAFFDIRKITYSNKALQFFHTSLDHAVKLYDSGQISEEEYQNFLTLGNESLGLTHWMKEAGFSYVQLLPNIWYKPNKTQGNVGDPNKGLIMAYEAFVLAGKGEPMLMKKGRQNIFGYNTPTGLGRDIDVQMPMDICSDLVSMICLGGSRILDPFAGSGAVGEGALSNQCEFLGFELDEKRAEVGNLRLKEHIHAKGGKNDGPEADAFRQKMQDYFRQQQELREAGIPDA